MTAPTADPVLAALANDHVAAAICREADAWAEQMNLAADPYERLLAFLEHEARCEACESAGCPECTEEA